MTDFYATAPRELCLVAVSTGTCQFGQVLLHPGRKSVHVATR